jgi:hypothetical protein
MDSANVRALFRRFFLAACGDAEGGMGSLAASPTREAAGQGRAGPASFGASLACPTQRMVSWRMLPTPCAANECRWLAVRMARVRLL